MRLRSRKHPNQIGADARNVITVPITPYNGTAAIIVSIGLINCQSICNKWMKYVMLLRILLRISMLLLLQKLDLLVKRQTRNVGDQLTFVSVEISGDVSIIYRLCPTKKRA